MHVGLGGLNEMSEKILIVEDDEAILEPLVDFLELQGYRVDTATNGRDGLALALGGAPDLVLLDVMLPRLSGLDVCRMLRDKSFAAPILMLTALDEEVDRVLGLESGADDYIPKPFSLREVVARIRAHLRREARGRKVEPVESFGDITVDRRAVRVYKAGEVVKCSAMEFKLLCYCMDSPGRAIARDELLDRVWGFDQMPSTRTVDTHVLQLRKKIGPYFETVHGVGYRFDA
jgi:two-component system alkaline phosphatase synthesis response regulator PhoP